MLILALDTSSKTESVALLKERDVLAEFSVHSFTNHSEGLLPLIEKVLASASVQVGDVDLFAVTIGPGSFTGLRIAASTVKGLALSTGKPVSGVSTVEVLAFNAVPSERTICPFLDAKRNEVYTALYKFNDRGGIIQTAEERTTDPAEFVRGLSEEVVFLGDGTQIYADLIRKECPVKSFFAPPHLHFIRASAVGALGREKYLEGSKMDVLAFAPSYHRLSQAEVQIGRPKRTGGFI